MMNTRCLFWKSVAVGALSVVLCYLFYYILDVNVLDYLSKQDNEADVVNFFYKIENRGPDENIYGVFYEDRIVLLDLAETQSRGDVAACLDDIASLNPQAIVLDIIFPAAAATDPAADRLLDSVVGAHDNIFTAVRLTDKGTERSFFTCPAPGKEGLVNRLSYHRPYEVFEGDTLRYMPYLVTGYGGTADTRRRFNYFDKEFDTLRFGDTFTRDRVNGRIILAGDLSDLRDTHDMPFRIGGSYRVPGTILMAHSLSTLLDDSWVVKIRDIWGILAAFIIATLFSGYCYYIRGSRRIDEHWAGFIEGISRIILIILMMLVAYWIFSSYHALFNLVYTMLALALTGFSMDVVELWEWYRIKHHKNNGLFYRKKANRI